MSYILKPINSLSPAATFLSPFTILGALQIIERLTKTAEDEQRPLIVEPKWNETNRLIPGPTQCLCFAFCGAAERRVVFLTSEIELYGQGELTAVTQVDARVNQLME